MNDGNDWDRERMQELDAAWQAAWPPVQAAADALDSDALVDTAREWAACASRYVRAVPIDHEYPLPRFPEHNQLIWGHMINLKDLGVALCKATQMRGNDEEQRARKCVTALTGVMRTHDLGDSIKCEGWADCETHIDPYLYETPLEGEVSSTLMLRLALCGTYPEDDMEEPGNFSDRVLQRIEVDVDYTHRVLERFLYVVASLGRFMLEPLTNEMWRRYLGHASYAIWDDPREGGGINTTTVLRDLLRAPGLAVDGWNQLKPVEHPAVRTMLKSIRSQNRRLIATIGSPDRPSQHTWNSLLWAAGDKHVRKAKKACYAALYAKVRAHVRMRGIALYWQEATEKRMCAEGGASRAAHLAALAEMDVAA